MMGPSVLGSTPPTSTSSDDLLRAPGFIMGLAGPGLSSSRSRRVMSPSMFMAVLSIPTLRVSTNSRSASLAYRFNLFEYSH